MRADQGFSKALRIFPLYQNLKKYQGVTKFQRGKRFNTRAACRGRGQA